MKNKKIVQAFDLCGPDEDTRKEMLKWVLENGEKEERKKENVIRYSIKRWAVTFATILLFFSIPIAGYATYKWLTGEQVALILGNEKLAETFGQTKQDIQIKTSGNYEIAYIGSVSGKNISDDIGLSSEIDHKRTYAAVAVARTDGQSMTKEMIVVTPFIQGLEPWKYNIYTLGNGSARSIIKDGILYWVMEINNIEMFSDRTLYIAVMGEHLDFDAFHFDENTGFITENTDYKGIHALFTMNTKQMKSDSIAAGAFLDSLHLEWKNAEEKAAREPEGDDVYKRALKYQDTVWTDEQSNLKITFPFYNIIKGPFYGFYCNIEGSGIEKITYSLNQGVFYHKTEGSKEQHGQDSINGDQEGYTAFLQKECILNPKVHEDSGCMYPGSQEQNGWLYEKSQASYTVDFDQQSNPQNLFAICPAGEEGKTTSESLAETTVTVTIHYLGGSTIEKLINFEEIVFDSDSYYADYLKIEINTKK